MQNQIKVCRVHVTYVKISIPHCGLGWRSTAARIFVQQEAKDIQQEEDRGDVQICEKALEKE